MGLEVVARTTAEVQHQDDITSVVVKNGNVYSSADDCRIKSWSPELQLVREVKGHDYSINCLEATDDDLLYSCSADSTIREWRLPDLTQENTLSGHSDSVRRLRFHGGKLYSGDDIGEVRVWENGQLKRSLPLVEEVWGLEIHENLIFTARDRDVVISRMHGVKSFTTAFTMEGRAPIVFSGKENKVCFLSRDGMNINVYEFGTWKLLKEMKEHDRIVNAMASVGDLLYTGGWDHLVKRWDLAEGRCTGSVDVGNCVTALGVDEHSGAVYAGLMGGCLIKLK